MGRVTGSTDTGPTSRKMDFFTKNTVLGQFSPFLDLLDLKNGSGSKFRVEWYDREVWRSKIKPFRNKFLNSLALAKINSCNHYRSLTPHFFHSSYTKPCKTLYSPARLNLMLSEGFNSYFNFSIPSFH